MINLNGSGRKRSCPNVKYYPDICLEGLRKPMKNLRIVGLQPEI
jgi:hypothetical protein